MEGSNVLSIIYVSLYGNHNTRDRVSNQTLKGIEIIDLEVNNELEILYRFKEVLDKVNGEYVSLVCEGDTFPESYFNNVIKKMKDKDADVAISSQFAIDPMKKNDKASVCNQKLFKTNFVNLNNIATFPLSLNGLVIKKTLFDKYSIRDRGIDTQKDFLVRMFMGEKKYLYIPELKYLYSVARDECFRYFTGIVERDWYYKSFEEWLIPLLEEINNTGDVPLFVQGMAMHMIHCRFEANSNNRNKHVIEGKDDVEAFLKLCSKVMQYVDDRVVLNVDRITGCPTNINMVRLYLQIKNWDFNLQFKYLRSNLGIMLGYNDYILINTEDIKVNIQLIDYIDGKWKIDLSIPSYFPTKDVRYFAQIEDEEYEIEYDERYSITKFFGESAYKNITGKCTVNLHPEGKRQTLSFYIEYEGVRYRLGLDFNSHTSRLTIKPRYSYWNFDKYTAFLQNRQQIVIQKRKARVTAYREFRCGMEMLLSRKKVVWILLLIRMAYIITRPYYKRRTIWMFYDKLYKGGDSSEYLFKYAKKKRDKVKKYYVLDKKSVDFKRMRKEGYHPIVRNSPRHYLTFMNASMMVVSNSTVFAFHNLSVANSAYLKGFIDFHVCCVQHGLSVQKIAVAQQRLRDNTRLYFCASKYEIDNLSKPVYDYEGSDALKLTGVARHDGLVNEDKRQILISPTWRMQSALLVTRNEGVQRDYNPHFKESMYYKVYNSLINDDRLIEAAKKYDYRIHYVLHPIVSSQSEDFDKNDYVDIIPSVGDMSYEKEFRESSLMVTDFSGVQFDFAYMRKPVVYLHHKDIPQHYEEGTFTYKDMGFGEICNDNDELINILIEYMKNNCEMKDEYKRRADDFFEYSDHNNCQRIYDEMIKYQKRLWDAKKK